MFNYKGSGEMLKDAEELWKKQLKSNSTSPKINKKDEENQLVTLLGRDTKFLGCEEELWENKDDEVFDLPLSIKSIPNNLEEFKKRFDLKSRTTV